MDINLQTVFYFYKKNLIVMYCYLFLELFIHHLEKLCIMTSRTSYLDLPQQGMCDGQQHFKSVCLLKFIDLSMHWKLILISLMILIFQFAKSS